MMYILEIPVTFPDGIRPHVSMGSIFHGALMERLPKTLQNTLHQQTLRPFSQSLIVREGKAYWHITCLTDAMRTAIEQALMQDRMLTLQQKSYAVQLGTMREVATSTAKEIADNAFLTAQSPWSAELTFLTPTSFRQEGHYVMFPAMRLLLQSLIARWNMLTGANSLDAPDLATELSACTHITAYHLHSAPFHLERTKIIGFRGQLRLRLSGNDMQRRLCTLLLSFAPFAGIGVKTALGMGAVNVAWLDVKE